MKASNGLARVTALVGALAGLVLARPTEGQPLVGEVGVGYAVNAPELMLGVTLQASGSAAGGLGVFLDIKLDLDDPGDEPNFLADETAQDVARSTNHEFFQDDDGWLSVSGGLTRPLVGARLAGYAGAGYTRRTRYNEYFDPTRVRGRGGFYWVEDPERSGAELNLLAGVIIRIAPRVRVRLGGELAPGGTTIAGLLAVPIG